MRQEALWASRWADWSDSGCSRHLQELLDAIGSSLSPPGYVDTAESTAAESLRFLSRLAAVGRLRRDDATRAFGA